MPRKAKDKEEIIEVKKTTIKKSTVTSSKSSTKKTTSKTKTTTSKVKKASSKAKTPASKSKKSAKKVEILEYYDLPYKYNQTVVKILAQSPDTLFVYWDISDKDKENYIKQYGDFFFNDTKPVLVVHNDTMHYSYEVDINDYANSWYLNVKDSNCDYSVELGRRPINEYSKIDNYLAVSSSNDIDAPNDHILFDSLNKNMCFRNVKTNNITEKDITLSFITKIGKFYSVKDFYKTMYKDENINFENLSLKNMPSS